MMVLIIIGIKIKTTYNMSPIRGFFGSQLNKETPTISIDFDYWENVSYLGDNLVIQVR